jgi:hypothetical protein
VNIWQRLKALLAYEPAVLAWAVNGGIATGLAFVAHLSPVQVAAVTTITTVLSAVYTAIRAHPVSVSLLTGAVATIATASAAFGLHLSAAVIATAVTVLSAVLGLVFRASLTPKAGRRPEVPDTPAAHAA